MVNRKSWINDTTALGSAGTLNGDEVVRVIDDPSGTPASKKSTVSAISTKVISDLAALGSTIEWIGAWQTSTAYAAQDGVENDGSSYICTSSHTSGASTEPGVGASWETVWDLLASKGDQGDQGIQGVQGADGQVDLNWGQPHLIHPYSLASPSPGTLAVTSTSVTFATSDRFYRVVNMSNMGWPGGVFEGESILFRFTLESGTVPSTKTVKFYDAINGGGSQVGSTQTFSLNGSHYEIETTIPAGTLSFIIDLTAGASAVISRPTYRFDNRYVRNVREEETLFLENKILDSSYVNLWSSGFVAAGGGTNSSGTFAVAAGSTAATATISGTRVSSEADMVVGFRVTKQSDGTPVDFILGTIAEYRLGANSSSHSDFYSIGDGWFISKHTIGASVGIANQLKLQINNNSPSGASYTAVDINITDVFFIEGTILPTFSPVGTPSNYTPEEIVVQVVADTTCKIFYKGNNNLSDKYIEVDLVRTDEASTNSHNWTWVGSWICERTGFEAFTRLDQFVTGENSFVLYKQGATSGAGGATHDNHSDTDTGGFARLLIDGNVKDLGTSAWYHCTRVELQTNARTYEDDHTTETAVIVSTHRVQNRKITVEHAITWSQSMNVNVFYAHMLAIYRNLNNDSGDLLVTDKAALSPFWEELDVSTSGYGTYNGTSYGNSDEVRMWGDAGIGVRIKALTGWDQASRNLRINDSGGGPKIYFEAIKGNVAVTSGNTYKVAAEYEISYDG